MRRRRLFIWFVCVPAGAVMASILLVILLKWVPVTATPLMLRRHLERGYGRECSWTPLERISPAMVSAVIYTEDQRFRRHRGFDFEEIRRMKQAFEKEGAPLRGCSTISQQTAKNCFTFCTDTWLRKAVEAYYTVLIERIWGKDRILEVYLNVAEFGPGIYGVEAAARRFYAVHAGDLTISDASSLVCCLPAPLVRNPEWVNIHMAARRATVAQAVAGKRPALHTRRY